MLTKFTYGQHDDITLSTTWFSCEIFFGKVLKMILRMILTLFTQVLTTPSVVSGDVSACKTTCMVSVIQCEYRQALTLDSVGTWW